MTCATDRLSMTKYTRPPPDGYLCLACKQRGHWIWDCAQVSFDLFASLYIASLYIVYPFAFTFLMETVSPSACTQGQAIRHGSSRHRNNSCNHKSLSNQFDRQARTHARCWRVAFKPQSSRTAVADNNHINCTRDCRWRSYAVDSNRSKSCATAPTWINYQDTKAAAGTISQKSAHYQIYYIQ